MLEEDNSQSENTSPSQQSPKSPKDMPENNDPSVQFGSDSNPTLNTSASLGDPDQTVAGNTPVDQQLEAVGDTSDQTIKNIDKNHLGAPALLQVPNDSAEDQSLSTADKPTETAASQEPSLEQRLAHSVAISAPKPSTSATPLQIQRTSSFSANPIKAGKVNIKSIKANTLGPREQEAADEPVLRGIHHLFNNRFTQAKNLFEEKADSDPLYCLGLGSMAFLIATMVSVSGQHQLERLVC